MEKIPCSTPRCPHCGSLKCREYKCIYCAPCKSDEYCPKHPRCDCRDCDQKAEYKLVLGRECKDVNGWLKYYCDGCSEDQCWKYDSRGGKDSLMCVPYECIYLYKKQY